VTAPTIELPLSPKQLLSVREASGRVNIWHGSVRSGKTVASLLRWLIDVATCDVQGEIVVVSRTRDSAARNVFAPLMDPALFGTVAKHVSYTPGAATATVLGRKVWVLGSSDVRSETVLRGLTCLPAPTSTRSRCCRKTSSSSCSTGSGKARGCSAPPTRTTRRTGSSASSSTGSRRCPTGASGTSSSTTTRNCTRTRRRRSAGRTSASTTAATSSANGSRPRAPCSRSGTPTCTSSRGTRCRRCCGSSASASTTAPPTPPPGCSSGLGVDRRLYAVDEWRYDPAVAQVRLTDAQLSASFRTWLAAGHTPEITNLQPEWVVVDPAAASFKVQLHNDGVRGLADAENDVSYGIRTMSSLLGAQQLLVSDRCTGLITEIPGYSWDDKATEKGEDKPIKTADHSIDGMRYAVATTEALWQGQLTLEPREAA
jgi:hypothetical protein